MPRTGSGYGTLGELLAEGVPLQEVSWLAGHASAYFTADTYPTGSSAGTRRPGRRWSARWGKPERLPRAPIERNPDDKSCAYCFPFFLPGAATPRPSDVAL